MHRRQFAGGMHWRGGCQRLDSHIVLPVRPLLPVTLGRRGAIEVKRLVPAEFLEGQFRNPGTPFSTDACPGPKMLMKERTYPVAEGDAGKDIAEQKC